MTPQTLDIIFNITGIIGVSLILLAYFLLQIEKVRSDNIIYPVLNLVGASLLLISLFRFWNLPSVIIEFFWILISIYGIYKIIKKPKN
jgi:hypothetical protein